MKNLFSLFCLFGCITFTTSCSKCKDKEFFMKYAHVGSGTNVHTATIVEALLTIAKNDLAKCKSECEIIQKDIKRYSLLADRYHEVLKRFDLDRPGCPCIPAGSCPWHISALARYINDNRAYKINDLHIEDENGNVISKVKNRIDSPSGQYTVLEMDGIDKITQNRVILSITLDGQDAKKLMLYLNGDFKDRGP